MQTNFCQSKSLNTVTNIQYVHRKRETRKSFKFGFELLTVSSLKTMRLRDGHSAVSNIIELMKFDEN